MYVNVDVKLVQERVRNDLLGEGKGAGGQPG